MRPLFAVIAVVAMSLSSSAFSAENCTAGQRRLNDGEPCIPETLFNYLYCLSKSGGGKVEVTKKDDSSAAKGLEISVGGKGSGVIVKGEGNVGFKQTDANRVVKELSERIDPSLASKCESLSRPPATSPRSSAPTARTDLPSTKQAAPPASKAAYLERPGLYLGMPAKEFSRIYAGVDLDWSTSEGRRQAIFRTRMFGVTSEYTYTFSQSEALAEAIVSSNADYLLRTIEKTNRTDLLALARDEMESSCSEMSAHLSKLTQRYGAAIQGPTTRTLSEYNYPDKKFRICSVGCTIERSNASLKTARFKVSDSVFVSYEYTSWGKDWDLIRATTNSLDTLGTVTGRGCGSKLTFFSW